MAHSVNRQSREVCGGVKNPAKKAADWKRVESLLPALSKNLGIKVRKDLLMRCFTHRSFSHEHPDAPNNERLEFLGDSVIQFVSTASLFSRFPHMREGELSSLRSAVVCQSSLAQIASFLHLGDFILLGRGAQISEDGKKESILCDTFESLVGAIFLDCGLEGAKKFAGPLLEEKMEKKVREMENENPALDWKTSLMVLSHSMGFGDSYFETSFNAERERFVAKCKLTSGLELATGEGRSKKGAQSASAKLSWKMLKGMEASQKTE